MRKKSQKVENPEEDSWDNWFSEEFNNIEDSSISTTSEVSTTIDDSEVVLVCVKQLEHNVNIKKKINTFFEYLNFSHPQKSSYF